MKQQGRQAGSKAPEDGPSLLMRSRAGLGVGRPRRGRGEQRRGRKERRAGAGLPQRAGRQAASSHLCRALRRPFGGEPPGRGGGGGDGVTQDSVPVTPEPLPAL